MSGRRAVVLLSGGLDSATALALSRSKGFETYALSVDYGQRHRVELERAATVSAFDIFIGANILDYSGYPDCRPEFLEAFERLANLATKAAVEGRGRFRIHAPLLRLTKADIIRKGLSLGV